MSGRYPRSWRVRARQGQPTITPPTGRQWYRIRGATTEVAEILLYGEIGYWGTTSSDFARELEAVTARKISLRINSEGGEVFDGIAIYEALRRHPAEVTAYVDALAASIASVIAMAGDRIVMAEPASLMIHDAWGVCVGPAADMEATRDLLDQISGTLSEIYAKRAGGTPAKWRKAMLAETWYTATEAVAAGLADAVGDSTEMPRFDDEDEPDELAAAFRRALTTAAAGLPDREPVVLTETQAGLVADAIRNAFGDPDVEWIDGHAYASPEAAAFDRLPKHEQAQRIAAGWLQRRPRGLR